jgi:hypothetical protein
MSRLLAVTARELRERWLLFPAGLAIGFVPLVLPAFGVRRGDSQFVGLFSALVLGAAAAVVMGSSMLARDASNGRLGFLFSRPLPWGTIWGGKWLAAVVLVVATGFLAAIPWMAVYAPETHGGSWLTALLDGPGSAFLFTLIVLALGLANFNATAFRSRSPWVVLDLLLLLAGLWTVRRYVAPLWLYGILGKDHWTTALALLPLALGLLAGSLAQVAVGRTDLRRAHRAMSLAFWAVVGLTLAVAVGYWQWVRSAGPDAVRVHAVTRDPGGRWVYVEGSGHHSGWYPHGFLIDTATGGYLARPGPDEELERYGVGMLFSADGRFGALPGRDHDSHGAALRLFDLTGEMPRLTEVTLESSPPPTWGTSFALSPSAESVFMAHESGASLFALPSGQRVATTTIPPGWRPAAVRFLAEATARVWLVPWSDGPGAMRPRAEMRVVDLAADGQSRAVTFSIATSLDSARAWGAVVPDAEGRRILTRDAGLHLRDGATGELVASLVEGPEAFPALFLADGRIVVDDSRAGASFSLSPHSRLRVFDRVGAKLGDIDLPLPPWGLSVGPEVAPGRVVVSCFRSPFLSEDTLVVDVTGGGAVDKLPGLRPAIGFWGVSSSVPASGAVSSVHFFRDVEGRVLRIDFATGERKVVAGPGTPRGERISVR